MFILKSKLDFFVFIKVYSIIFLRSFLEHMINEHVLSSIRKKSECTIIKHPNIIFICL